MANDTLSIGVLAVVLALTCGAAVSVDGQTQPEPVDTINITDTTIVPPDTLSDSTATADTTRASDTLTEAQRMLMEFEERYRERQAEQKEKPVRQFSYYDTMLAYFASPYLNKRELVDRSLFHDPGGYFKVDPGYFVTDFQVTPMRKIVQPFGLAGNRLAFVHDGYRIQPFEHVPEPDGLVDLNNVPSALDDDIYIMPGVTGRLFGGDHALATLVTRPDRPEDNTSHSAFIVDKGSFGYSYARGRYSRLFSDGRKMDLSIGYRNADGPRAGFSDNAYHYFGNIYWPVWSGYAVALDGHVYNREGGLAIRPNAGGALQLRDGFDKSLQAAIVRHNEYHTARYEVGYDHIRKASYLNRPYRGAFDLTGHGGFISGTWISGEKLLQTRASFNYLEYEFGRRNNLATRLSGEVKATFALLGQRDRLALLAGQGYVENFKFLPYAVIAYMRESNHFFTLVSAGYSERAPSLQELYLPLEVAGIYGRSATDYADHGNPELHSEKQLIGSVDMALGSVDNNLGVHVVGGHIYDGIDWWHDESDGDQTVFSPLNGDVDFLSPSGDLSVRVADFIRFHGGASYHWVDYEHAEERAYTPEFQTFSGLELHVYWPQRLIHLFAYGEIVYTGAYDGYDKTGLGENPVANVKLSFQMSKFRFHFVIQNALSRVYDAREDFFRLGRYNYWGFVWNFLN
jgi:hypothetical protein